MIDEEPPNQKESGEGETPVSTPQTSNTFSYTPRDSNKRGVLLRWLVIIVILGALVFAVVSFFRSQQESRTEEVTPTPTVEVTPTETPTPQASPTSTKKPTATPIKTATGSAVPSKGLTLKVLNGSGITGRAAGVRDFLVGLGYTVSSIGNADSENYDKVVITISKAKEAQLAILKKDLEAKYLVGTTSATLSSSEGVDAVVIIGKQ